MTNSVFSAIVLKRRDILSGDTISDDIPHRQETHEYPSRFEAPGILTDPGDIIVNDQLDRCALLLEAPASTQVTLDMPIDAALSASTPVTFTFKGPCLLTDRFRAGPLNLAYVAPFRAVFVEGELEENLGQWPGRTTPA